MLSQCTSVVVAAYGLRGATHYEPWQTGVSAFAISGMPRGNPPPPDFLPLSCCRGSRSAVCTGSAV